MNDRPEQPSELGPDGGWPRDGQQWQSVPHRSRRVLTRRHLAVFALVIGLLAAVFLVTWHQVSAPTNAGEWRTMTARDSLNMAGAEAAVTGCTTVTDCRSKVQALGDQLATFQRDLDRRPAPACLEAPDQQLRLAVSDARSATQTHIADSSDPAAMAQYAASTAHLQQASRLLAAARC